LALIARCTGDVYAWHCFACHVVACNGTGQFSPSELPDMTQPNVLVLMADQVNGTLFPDGPVDFLHTPHLRALAERAVRFANAYSPSYLCAPGRAAFMSGQLPSRTGVYDNGAEFA